MSTVAEFDHLRDLRDRLELAELEGEYGPAYDGCDAERWAALFADDGIYQGQRIDGAPEPNFVRGRESLVRFCREQPGSGIHTMHAPQITVDGDTATGRVHFQFQSFTIEAHGASHTRSSTGVYDIAYVRTPAGWRIKRRITTFFGVSLHSHFGRYPAPADLDGPLPYGDVDYVDRRS